MSIITKEIGRVSIVPKGAWNSNNTYTRLDLVNYNGNSYIAKQNVPINININNENYWKMIAKKGDPGASINDIRKTGTSIDGLTDTYTVYLTDGETTTFQVKNGNGIASITGPSTSGLIDTYTINFTNGETTTFNVKNGTSISNIRKTSTSGLIDTYTISFTDGTSATFNVQNGKSIDSITEVDVTHAADHIDKYRINFNDNTTFDFQIYNGKNGRDGTGLISTVDEITSDDRNVELLILGNGAPTENTVGQLKQRYYDRTNQILYICTNINTSGAQTIYTWQSTGVPVDNGLSEISENPVQNKVITGKIGTTELNTTAKDLSRAVNELRTQVLSNSSIKVDDTVIAPIYQSSSRSYIVGEYIWYVHKLYRCIESYTGIWDATKWEQVTITNELDTKAPIGLGITNASIGKVPIIGTVNGNGVPTSYDAVQLYTMAEVDTLLAENKIPIWPTTNGNNNFTTIQDVVDVLTTMQTRGIIIGVFSADMTGDLFSEAFNYQGMLLVFKASSNNAYYLAFSRDHAAVGNISITNASVTKKTALV